MTGVGWDAEAAVGRRNLADVVWGTGEGDGVALIEHPTGRTHRYQDLLLAGRRFAAALRRRGLRPGESVAIVCDNSGEFIASYYGTLWAGGVVLPLEPLGSGNEWHTALSHTRPRFAVVTATVWQKLEGQAFADSFRHVFVIGEGGTRPASPTVEAADWDRMLGAETATEAAEAAEGGARTALLAASSGSSGTPKQIVLTHHNLAANILQVDFVHRLTADDVVLGITPFRHLYGMQIAMNRTLRARGTLVSLATPFSAENLLDAVQRHRVTVAYVVPSVLAELARFPGVERYDTSSLRMLHSGGAPLPLAIAETCARVLGAEVVQSYGMTEAAGCTHAPPDGSPSPPGSIGVPVPGTQTRFVDPDTGLDVGNGASGEIWIRGPQISPGCLQGPDGVVPVADAEGWLHTGDIGRGDARGYVTITGRCKQLIKYKGHQVAPAELEAILLGHPDISDAVVVGVPDEAAGEIPKAYVVLSAPVPLDEVSAYVAERVAPYKKIRRIEAVPRIPRSPMGKVLRGALGSDR
ncbi:MULTISPECIES: AMP-binding protein [unclassified Streptomyces]|uniref:AMP-binding protein n=1 Tax=unclassified Streptomyces TaxID=2593676 RepID=UPI00336A5631